MKIYAIFAEDGRPLAFYEMAGRADLTLGVVVEIDEPQWQEMICNPGRRRWLGGQVVAYEPPAPEPVVPAVISDRQFAQGLAVAGLISEAEAEDWVGPGTVPAAVLVLVDGLPEGDRFAARMLLRGAQQFERAHPLTPVLAAAYGWSEAQTDQFWRDCSAL